MPATKGKQVKKAKNKAPAKKAPRTTPAKAKPPAKKTLKPAKTKPPAVKAQKAKPAKPKPPAKKTPKAKPVKDKAPAKKTEKAKPGVGNNSAPKKRKATPGVGNSNTPKKRKATPGNRETQQRQTSTKKETKDQGKTEVPPIKKRKANPVKSEPPKKKIKTQAVVERCQMTPAQGHMAFSSIPHSYAPPVTVVPIAIPVPVHDARTGPGINNNGVNAAPHSSHRPTDDSAASAPALNANTNNADDLKQDENHLFLVKNRSDLIDRVKNVVGIVDELALTNEKMAIVGAQPTDHAKMRQLLDFCKTSKAAAKDLVTALWKHERDVMKDLAKPSSLD